MGFVIVLILKAIFLFKDQFDVAHKWKTTVMLLSIASADKMSVYYFFTYIINKWTININKKQQIHYQSKKLNTKNLIKCSMSQ